MNESFDLLDDNPVPELALSISELEVGYPGFRLGPLSFDLPANAWACVVGLSGCGKTTLLRALNFLVPPKRGAIRILDTSFSINDEPFPDETLVREVRKNVGMVFQQPGLWPYLTLLENVAEAPTTVLGISKRQARSEALEWLQRVGLADKANQYPREVSGGQAQRTALARALAMKPKILLCDEITSGLDSVSTMEVLELLESQQKEIGLTIMMSTHNLTFLRRVATNVLVIDGGILVESTTPENFFSNPASEAGQKLLRAANYS